MAKHSIKERAKKVPNEIKLMVSNYMTKNSVIEKIRLYRDYYGGIHVIVFECYIGKDKISSTPIVCEPNELRKHYNWFKNLKEKDIMPSKPTTIIL